MAEERETVTTVSTLTLSEEEIRHALKAHVARENGERWLRATCHLSEVRLPTQMGDIDDRTELRAVLRIEVIKEV